MKLINKKVLEKASKKTWTKWNKTGIKIYGWLDGSMNVSTSKPNGFRAKIPIERLISPES